MSYSNKKLLIDILLNFSNKNGENMRMFLFGMFSFQGVSFQLTP